MQFSLIVDNLYSCREFSFILFYLSYKKTNSCNILDHGPSTKPDLIIALRTICKQSIEEIAVCKISGSDGRSEILFGTSMIHEFPYSRNFKYNYDYNSKSLILFEGRNVFKIHANGTKEKILTDESLKYGSIKSTTYEGENNKIYINYFGGQLGVLNLNKPKEGIHGLFNLTKKERFYINNPTFYPKKGLMFFGKGIFFIHNINY